MCLLSVAYAVATDAPLCWNVEFANLYLVCLEDSTFILLVSKGTRVVCDRGFVSKFAADDTPGLVSSNLVVSADMEVTEDKKLLFTVDVFGEEGWKLLGFGDIEGEDDTLFATVEFVFKLVIKEAFPVEDNELLGLECNNSVVGLLVVLYVTVVSDEVFIFNDLLVEGDVLLVFVI